jgi:hypothetical protein
MGQAPALGQGQALVLVRGWVDQGWAWDQAGEHRDGRAGGQLALQALALGQRGLGLRVGLVAQGPFGHRKSFLRRLRTPP